jgi:hypothetical protein
VRESYLGGGTRTIHISRFMREISQTRAASLSQTSKFSNLNHEENERATIKPHVRDQGRIREIPYAHLSQKNPDPYKVTFVTTLFSPSTPTHPDDNLFCEATRSRAKAESSSI